MYLFRILQLFAIPAVACLAIGCASYQIGNEALFRHDVRTVHVPVFESESFRKYLGERLTEAVIKEIESRTQYKVARMQTADSILSGRIVAENKLVAIESINDDARNLVTSINVIVDWKDRYGRPLMVNQAIQINEQANFTPEGGQSLSTAQQEAIERAARDIVSQMELAW